MIRDYVREEVRGEGSPLFFTVTTVHKKSANSEMH